MYTELLHSITAGSTISIMGRQFVPLACALYCAKKSPTSEYGKIFFESHYVVVISPDDELIYFGKNEGNLGNDRLNRETFEIGGETYTKTTEDVQHLSKIVFGDSKIVEGDMSFWDYEGKNDPTNIISLGLNDENGERADIVARTLGLSDINVN